MNKKILALVVAVLGAAQASNTYVAPTGTQPAGATTGWEVSVLGGMSSGFGGITQTKGLFSNLGSNPDADPAFQYQDATKTVVGKNLITNIAQDVGLPFPQFGLGFGWKCINNGFMSGVSLSAFWTNTNIKIKSDNDGNTDFNPMSSNNVRLQNNMMADLAVKFGAVSGPLTVFAGLFYQFSIQRLFYTQYEGSVSMKEGEPGIYAIEEKITEFSPSKGAHGLGLLVGADFYMNQRLSIGCELRLSTSPKTEFQLDEGDKKYIAYYTYDSSSTDPKDLKNESIGDPAARFESRFSQLQFLLKLSYHFPTACR